MLLLLNSAVSSLLLVALCAFSPLRSSALPSLGVLRDSTFDNANPGPRGEQALLTAVLDQTVDAELISGWHGHGLAPAQVEKTWRYQPLRPKWWKTIFDQAHVTLDCHNPHEDDPAGGADFADRTLGAAPFDILRTANPAGGAIMALVQCDICQLLRGWQKHRDALPKSTKFVLLGDMSQDWSILSASWDVLKGKWFDLEVNLDKCQIKKAALQSLLDDPRLTLWVTAQHAYQAHPKILSLPLGVFHPTWLKHAMRRMVGTRRPTLVGDTSVTSSSMRSAVSDLVRSKIGSALERIPPTPDGFAPHDVGMTDGYKNEPCHTAPDGCSIPRNLQAWYWNFTAAAKFSLSPPGTGFDCYRTWEALALGSIPIVEHSTFDRTFAGLPVMLVDDFGDVSVSNLTATYAEFVRKADDWDFTRLTPKYWSDLIAHVLATGSSDIVQKNHPIPAGYYGEFTPYTTFLAGTGKYTAGIVTRK